MNKEMLDHRSVFVQLRKPNKGLVAVQVTECLKGCNGGPIGPHCPLSSGLKPDQILTNISPRIVKNGVCRGVI